MRIRIHRIGDMLRQYVYHITVFTTQWLDWQRHVWLLRWDCINVLWIRSGKIQKICVDNSDAPNHISPVWDVCSCEVFLPPGATAAWFPLVVRLVTLAFPSSWHVLIRLSTEFTLQSKQKYPVRQLILSFLLFLSYDAQGQKDLQHISTIKWYIWGSRTCTPILSSMGTDIRDDWWTNVRGKYF